VKPAPEWIARAGQILNPGLGLLVDFVSWIKRVTKRIIERIIERKIQTNPLARFAARFGGRRLSALVGPQDRGLSRCVAVLGRRCDAAGQW